MKKLLLLSTCVLFSALSCLGQATNDFFDNTPGKKLPGALKIEVAGEVANPGTVDLERLPLRTLIVREARLEKDGVAFVGAYRYEGYSLLDILNDRVVAKTHGAGFKPQTDLLVAVENAAGDKAVLSWGEIFYPAALHRVIIAASAAPIIPSETKENWPLAAARQAGLRQRPAQRARHPEPDPHHGLHGPPGDPRQEGAEAAHGAELPGSPPGQTGRWPSTRPPWPRRSGPSPRSSTAAARVSTASSSSPGSSSGRR